MNKAFFIVSILFSVLSSCQTEGKTDKNEYLRWVGDIEQKAEIDDPDFKVCNGDNRIVQYFNIGQGPVYKGEKTSIFNHFEQKYKPVERPDQNGMIRIRFVVNCEGKAGRFRVIQSDYNYKESEFDKRLTTQLVDITKEIEKWEVLSRNEFPLDYYFYLIFKIEAGRIIEILP